MTAPQPAAGLAALLGAWLALSTAALAAGPAKAAPKPAPARPAAALAVGQARDPIADC